VATLMQVVEGEFQSKGDHSRALAAFITPAMRMRVSPAQYSNRCGQLGPVVAGRSYRHELVRAV
jgi:hypothetical protein